MSGSYYAHATIYTAGWARPVRVPVSEVTALWEVNGPGRWSAIVPVETYLPGATSRARDWKNKWVLWRHPTCGVWGGYIEDDPVEINRHELELSAVGFGQLLQFRLTPVAYAPAPATAGQLLSRGLSDVENIDALTWEYRIESWGPYLSVDFRADPILSLMRRLQRESGQEWFVGVEVDEDFPDRKRIVLEWRRQIGGDLTGRILLVEGYHFGGRIDRSASQLVTELTGIADDVKIGRTVRVDKREHRVARLERGLRQASKRFPNTAGESLTAARMRAYLRDAAYPTLLPTIEMVGTDPHTRLIRDGDLLRLHSRAVRDEVKARVMRRAIDTTSNILTLALDEERSELL